MKEEKNVTKKKPKAEGPNYGNPLRSDGSLPPKRQSSHHEMRNTGGWGILPHPNVSIFIRYGYLKH
tara:strand:+ start:480 stop:677 length:198 start_codon:yes stop_codon:yes gene_type:complete